MLAQSAGNYPTVLLVTDSEDIAPAACVTKPPSRAIVVFVPVIHNVFNLAKFKPI